MNRQLNADQQNTNLEIGKLIDETSYQREKKKIYLSDISAQVDMITRKDGTLFIAEIKKSSKRLENAIIQLKYYLYLLREKSLDVKGLIKIPKEKKTVEVDLESNDIINIEKTVSQVTAVIGSDTPPGVIEKRVCSKCAHYDFCWA